jgi:hypothetical protein
MSRFLASLLFGLIVGGGLGLVLGWNVFPVEYVNGPASRLDQQYKDEYTVMVSAGYLVDSDIQSAVDRLRVLDLDDIPGHVQNTAERYISRSRNIEDIRYLVALAEAMGRLTDLMRDYRIVDPESRP